MVKIKGLIARGLRSRNREQIGATLIEKKVFNDKYNISGTRSNRRERVKKKDESIFYKRRARAGESEEAERLSENTLINFHLVHNNSCEEKSAGRGG